VSVHAPRADACTATRKRRRAEAQKHGSTRHAHASFASPCPNTHPQARIKTPRTHAYTQTRTFTSAQALPPARSCSYTPKSKASFVPSIADLQRTKVPFTHRSVGSNEGARQKGHLAFGGRSRGEESDSSTWTCCGLIQLAAFASRNGSADVPVETATPLPRDARLPWFQACKAQSPFHAVSAARAAQVRRSP